MQTKESLLKIFEEMALDYYETLSDIDEEAIELTDFEDFCRFVKKHKIDTVFYCFAYTSVKDYEITETLLGNIDEEIVNVMREDFNKYNQEVNSLDFDRPVVLTISCLYQGRTIFVAECDNWLEELGYEDPKRTVYSMVQSRMDEIRNEKEEASAKREKLREKLREKILTDPDFHNCTNKDLRRLYTSKIVQADKSIEPLFYSPKFGLYDIGINIFVEDIWREYNASL